MSAVRIMLAWGLLAASLMLGACGQLERAHAVPADALDIRKSKLNAPGEDVPRRTLTIAGRAISMLIAGSGVGDIYRIYTTTRHDGVGFNLAYSDRDFTTGDVGPFDPRYMVPPLQYGHERGPRRDPWKKAPPGPGAAS